VLNADVEVDRRDFTVRVAFAVAPGERLALFGPSGAGKTTILEVIAGLVPPRRGTVELGGRMLTRTSQPRCAVPPWRRQVGLLRQDPALFPHLSVRQNLTYAPGAASRGDEIGQIASRLGIGGLLGDRPARLSGGQAHRVALGRLLLAHCGALLLDEPYTGLDASLRRDLTDLVRELVAARQVPAVLVAHELDAAQAFADRLAVLDRGQIASRLGISGLLGDRPARLSGGQAHRVALGRLLLAHCGALLLDEPYTGLDASLRRDLTDLVRELVAARQVPAVLVAHELDAAQAFADRLAVLDRGQILQEGSPSEVVTGPASRRVAELVGYRSFVPVPSGAGPVVANTVVADTVVADTVAGVHPDRVIAGAQPDRGLVLTGQVVACRPAGAGWEATIDVAGGVLAVRLPDKPPDGAGYGDGPDSRAERIVLTVLDPPYFGPDGARLTAQVAG